MSRRRTLRSFVWWVTILPLLLITGCQTSSPTDPSHDAGVTDTRERAVATFDASGGLLMLPHGGLLVVPPGAVEGEVEVSVTVTAAADVPGVTTLGETWSLSPSGETFDPPLVLFLPAPDGVEPERLAAFLTSEDGGWDALPVRLARASHTARIEVPHFSDIVLGEFNVCDLVTCLSDGDPCTVDACSPLTGACWEPAPAGTSCETDACSVGFTCSSAGVCQGYSIGCDDGNPCTWDWCDPQAGCTSSGGKIDDFVAPGGLVDGRHLRFGPDGRLFVADPHAQLVRIYDDEGTMVDYLVTDYPRTLDFDEGWDLLVAGGSGWYPDDTEIVEFDVPDYDSGVVLLSWADADAQAAAEDLLGYNIGFWGQFTCEALRIIDDEVFVAGFAAGQSGPDVWQPMAWGGVIKLDRDGSNPEVFTPLSSPTALLEARFADRLLVAHSKQSSGDILETGGDQPYEFEAWGGDGGVRLYSTDTGTEWDPPIPDGEFNDLYDMAYGPISGWVYIATGASVRRFSLDAWELNLVDTYTSLLPGVPRGLAFDEFGFLYITVEDRIERYPGEAVSYDDGNPCTLGDMCGPGGTPVPGLPAPDAHLCWLPGDELGMCVEGLCVPADEACGAGEDPCVEIEGIWVEDYVNCSETLLTGPSCDDGDACTVWDSCDQGVCTGGGPAPCFNDPNPCVTTGCDSATGCIYEPVADGTVCDDGDLCTVNDLCDEGICVGIPMPCDDANPCTTDLCDESGGCMFEPATGPECPGGSCVEGACVPDGPDGIPALCVANEGTPSGVVCFDEAGDLVHAFLSTSAGGSCLADCPAEICPGPAGETCPEVTEASLAPIGASGIAALGGTLYLSTDNLCHLLAMDLGAASWVSAPMCYSVAQNNVNALGVRGDELVLVGSAGGWVHLWSPADGILTGPIVSGLDNPQGFAHDPATGLGYVIDHGTITELTPQADGAFAASVIHVLASVAPNHESQGGLALHDGVLWYTDFGSDFGAGHLVALDLATDLSTLVAEIPDNPRGLAVDPTGTWLYIARYSTPVIDGGFAPGGSIDRLLLSSAFGPSPVLDPWLTTSPHLQGPFGMVWTTLPAP